jgi:hypothetical protein|tara:strand:+ start:2991 stop:3164 length:174 start_codon:yes stop_codon:yes gene_type:complete
MAAKIFDIEILEDDMVYVGSGIQAKDESHALAIMIIISNGMVNEDSEIIKFEEKTLH